MSGSQGRIDHARHMKTTADTRISRVSQFGLQHTSKTLDRIQQICNRLIMETKTILNQHIETKFEYDTSNIHHETSNLSKGTATMTTYADNRLHEIEQRLKDDTQSPRAYFEAADAANCAGKTEKATRYLRIAFNTHNNQLLNQFDIKSLGETNNA